MRWIFNSRLCLNNDPIENNPLGHDAQMHMGVSTPSNMSNYMPRLVALGSCRNLTTTEALPWLWASRRYRKGIPQPLPRHDQLTRKLLVYIS
jgi:hypothetical protein